MSSRHTLFTDEYLQVTGFDCWLQHLAVLQSVCQQILLEPGPFRLSLYRSKTLKGNLILWAGPCKILNNVVIACCRTLSIIQMSMNASSDIARSCCCLELKYAPVS